MNVLKGEELMRQSQLNSQLTLDLQRWKDETEKLRDDMTRVIIHLNAVDVWAKCMFCSPEHILLSVESSGYD